MMDTRGDGGMGRALRVDDRGRQLGFAFSAAEAAAMLPRMAVGVAVDGVQAENDGDPPFDGPPFLTSWASQFGGLSATLVPPTSPRRPVFDAFGGVDGRPVVKFDGIDDTIGGAVSKGSTWLETEIGVVVRPEYTASGNRVASFGNTGNRHELYMAFAGNMGSIRTSGTASNLAALGAYSDAPRYWSSSSDGVAAHVARKNGTTVGSTTVTATAVPDGSPFFLGSHFNTSFYGKLEVHAWVVGELLTDDQREYLRALLTHYTGVDC